MEEVLGMSMHRVHEAVVDSRDRLSTDASHQKRSKAVVEARLTMLLKHGDYTSANILFFGQVPKKYPQAASPTTQRLCSIVATYPQQGPERRRVAR